MDMEAIASKSQPTETHKFIRTLRDQGKLLRYYTQNVDELDDRAGLSTDLGENSVECVPLHGSIHSLRCPTCCGIHKWNATLRATIAAEQEPQCPLCIHSPIRVGATRRESTIGRLRPNVIYLGEDHWQGERIVELINHDQSAGPDVLLILGTSLKVSGPRNLARRFARAVGANGGRVV